MKRIIVTALLLAAGLTLLLGLAYPLLVWGIGQIFFKEQAQGSMIVREGRTVGSRLIGQPFAGLRYFHSRPSASGYDASASGGSNLAPSNRALVDAVGRRIEAARNGDPRPVPLDMVEASASGLDPDISPAAAAWQAPRVARARGIDETTMFAIIKRHTERPLLGFIGEPRVNVLLLNLYLDERFGRGDNNERK
jgi:potassium-transporting ATPase KdpC subunit